MINGLNKSENHNLKMTQFLLTIFTIFRTNRALEEFHKKTYNGTYLAINQHSLVRDGNNFTMPNKFGIKGKL